MRTKRVTCRAVVRSIGRPTESSAGNGVVQERRGARKVALRSIVSVVWMGLVLAAACGGNTADGHPGDAGPAPDGAGGGSAGPDGGVDADPGDQPPPPPPPAPQGGELAWAVSTSGEAYQAAVAIGPEGSIFVAATQTVEVSLGDVHVPPPDGGGQALLVLKLTADGQPIWGRSVAGALEIRAHAIAVTPAGDPVIGGRLRNSLDYRADDGFVIALDGDDGTTRWNIPLASASADRVAGVAAGADAAGVDAIYVYGELGWSELDGQTFPFGTYLMRYDADGTRRWAQRFPRLALGFDDSLAFDPRRGPVITGIFSGQLTLGDRVLTAAPNGYDGVVVGLDFGGKLRFAQQIFSEREAYYRSVAVAPNGDVYLASHTQGSETFVDDRPIPSLDFSAHPFLLRLTPEGQYMSSSVIGSRRSAYPDGVATDAAGEVYLLSTCSGQVDVQPEITCNGYNNKLIVSYGADNEYRWAIYMSAADAIAAAPGNRLIVVGRAADGGLRIAAFATGPARLPSPLPTAPVIASVKLDGVADHEIRQGGTATLVIEGAGLDQVTRARLGDLDIHVPPGPGTAGVLRLPVTIPHGHAPGRLALRLGNAGGSTQLEDAVEVTPVVVSPTGSTGGRGTFASPMRLCITDWYLRLRSRDVLLLRDGVHTCDESVYVDNGVIIRGESKAGAIIRGTGPGGIGAFGGFSHLSGRLGPTVIENLTIESAQSAAIQLWEGGRVSIADVDVRGVSGSGIVLYGSATATVTRYRYEQSNGTALTVDGGSVDVSQIEVSGAFHGVVMLRGTLTLADSSLETNDSAVLVGDTPYYREPLDVTITRTTIRSKARGLDAVAAQVTVVGSRLEQVPGSTDTYEGIRQRSGVLTLTDSSVRGWPSSSCIFAEAYPHLEYSGELGHKVDLTLDRVDLTGCRTGVDYRQDYGQDGQLRLRRSRVAAEVEAVYLSGRVTSADLGTAASPGDNWLETAPGGTALVDTRAELGPAVDAHGTTLNGMTFDGSVLGPVDVPGACHIRAANELRF